MQAAGVERRRGNLEAAKEMFAKCLSQCQDKEDKDAHSHVSLKLARFTSMVSRFFFFFSFFFLLYKWNITMSLVDISLRWWIFFIGVSYF